MLTEKNSLASKIPNHWKPEAWVDRDVYGENQRDGKAWARMYKWLYGGNSHVGHSKLIHGSNPN